MKTSIFCPVKSMTLCAGLIALVFSSSGYAGLIGSSVTSQYYGYGGPYSLYGSPASFTANGAVQQTFCSSSDCAEGFNLTVSDNQVEYTMLDDDGYFSSTALSLNSNGLVIENGNLLTFNGVTITSVTLDPATNVPNFASSEITFNAGNIAVNWSGLSGISAGQQIILDVVTAAPTSTPEPASCVLLLTGLAGIAVRCVKRR